LGYLVKPCFKKSKRKGRREGGERREKEKKHRFSPLMQARHPLLKEELQKENESSWEKTFPEEEQDSGNKSG
jgi:hypothetical protein